MIYKGKKWWVIGFVLALGFMACGDDEKDDQENEPQFDLCGTQSEEVYQSQVGTHVFSRRGMVIGTNMLLPCDDLTGCPVERNREIFRWDFDFVTGDVTEVRLTDNSDGIVDNQQGVDADDDSFYSLSNDGQYFYFGNRLDGTLSIYKGHIDGDQDQIIALTDASTDHYFVKLSDDGQSIFYVTGFDNDSDLFRMSAVDGSNKENLTNNGVEEDILAFLANDKGVILGVGKNRNDTELTDSDQELYQLIFDTGNLTRITSDTMLDYFIGLSSDESKILYYRYEDQDENGSPDSTKPNLWMAYTDGIQEPVRLTSYTVEQLNGISGFLMDDRYFIYELRSPETDETARIYSYNLETMEEPIEICDSVAGESCLLRLISADEELMVYTTNDRSFENDGGGDIEIFINHISGCWGASRQLTTFENEMANFPLAILPAYNAILYDTDYDPQLGPVESGDTELYLVNLETLENTQLTDNDATDLFKSVSEDMGTMLFYNTDTVDGDYELAVMPIDLSSPMIVLSDNLVPDSASLIIME